MDRPRGIGDPWVRWAAATDEPLIVGAIERGQGTWRSAEEISRDTGVPLDRVQLVLETYSHGIIVAPPAGGNGPPLYSTRAHYRRTTGLLRRYLDALAAS